MQNTIRSALRGKWQKEQYKEMEQEQLGQYNLYMKIKETAAVGVQETNFL